MPKGFKLPSGERVPIGSKEHKSHLDKRYKKMERRQSHKHWQDSAGWKGLKELEGKKLASIVGMIKKPLAKSYGKMFEMESSEKNIFGKEGGWSFPIVNRVRGAIQAKRFQKALESGDIKSYGLKKEGKLTFGVDDIGRSTMSQTVGEYQKHSETKKRSDATMYLALDRPMRDVLSTLAHEGGHMETMTGKQVGHVSEHTGQEAFKTSINNPIAEYFDQLKAPWEPQKNIVFNESRRSAQKRWKKSRELSSLLDSLKR